MQSDAVLHEASRRTHLYLLHRRVKIHVRYNPAPRCTRHARSCCSFQSSLPFPFAWPNGCQRAIVSSSVCKPPTVWKTEFLAIFPISKCSMPNRRLASSSGILPNPGCRSNDLKLSAKVSLAGPFIRVGTFLGIRSCSVSAATPEEGSFRFSMCLPGRCIQVWIKRRRNSGGISSSYRREGPAYSAV